jgi:hypothetical protein
MDPNGRKQDDVAVNFLGGPVTGPVIQAGQVHGGVHFYRSDAYPMPVPRQAPAPPAHFVARRPEITELDRLAGSRPGPALIVLTGVGGVGKSALALSWAQQRDARFPDGQLYTNLGAFDPAGPVTPAEALGRMLQSLGVLPQHLPASVNEQAALFRSLSAGKRMLILLDDAVSAAQVKPLLPTSEGCVVVVTSRWRLGGLLADGARFLTVEPLSRPAAEELLHRVIGSDRTAEDPDATSALARLCGGLPIALVMTAACLVTRPLWPVSRAVDELSEERLRLPTSDPASDLSVQGVFDLSYAALPGPVSRCYRALGLQPGAEFGVHAVATALDVDARTADRQLGTLLDASMISETEPDRFRMHDLVRLHARRYAEADQEHPVMSARTIEWYLAGVLAADRILTPYRRRDPENPFTHLHAEAVALRDRDDALGWLEAERRNLVGCVRQTAPTNPLLAWRIADSLWPLFHLRRHHHDRMEVDRIAVRCARELRDPDREARMLRRWAFAHFDIGDYEEAAALFTRCRQLCEENGDRYGIASAAEGLGQVALARGEHEAAADFFRRQVDLCRELGERRRVGVALLNLGATANGSGRHRRAVEHLREANRIFVDLNGADPYNHTRSRIELGRALGNLGELAAARVELETALSDMQRLGSPRGEAQARHRLGEIALAERSSAARPHLAAALELYQQLGDVESDQVARLLGIVPPAEGDPDRMP